VGSETLFGFELSTPAGMCASELLFRPAGARFFAPFPTAHAVGCILTPLRG